MSSTSVENEEYLLRELVTLLVVEVRKMNKKQQGYNKATSDAQSTNASYDTEFATETNVQAVKQQNAQSEANKSQSSSSNQ